MRTRFFVFVKELLCARYVHGHERAHNFSSPAHVSIKELYFQAFFLFFSSKFWFSGSSGRGGGGVMVVGGGGCLKGQKMAQNDKKFCLSHSQSQELYIIWLWYAWLWYDCDMIDHIIKILIMISTDVFL